MEALASIVLVLVLESIARSTAEKSGLRMNSNNVGNAQGNSTPTSRTRTSTIEASASKPLAR